MGLIAIHLREDDELVGVHLTDGKQDIILGTCQGMSIRFPETDVRVMGRNATGVKGIDLNVGDSVIDMDIISEDSDVLVVTSKGYGKRTPVDAYRVQTRGGKGIKTLHRTEKNGVIAGLKVVNEEHDLMLVTSSGIIIRLCIRDISSMGRNTQGVKLISLKQDEEVTTVSKVEMSEEEEKERCLNEADPDMEEDSELMADEEENE